MKGFIAGCLFLAKILSKKQDKLTKRLYFAFTYNEETDFEGIYNLQKNLENQKLPTMCIVGEPTNMNIVHSHKGYIGFTGKTRGLACHSSVCHQGVNSVIFTSELINFISQLSQEKQKDGPFNHLFSPPFTTVHCGYIHGGHAMNIVPEECTFGIEIRPIPEENTEQLKSQIFDFVQKLEVRMKEKFNDCGFSIDLYEICGFSCDENSSVVKLVQKLIPDTKLFGVGYVTEAGVISSMGIPSTIVCGPGSIEQAHKPNEFVEIEQMKKLESFFIDFCDYLST